MKYDRNVSNESLQQVLYLNTRNNVFSNVPVICKSDFEYFIYIKIPDHLAISCHLFDVIDVSDKPTPVNYRPYFIRDCMKPWIRVESRALDLNVGQHTYKFQFINKNTNDTFSLYMSYIVQDSDADKPYIYIDREGDTSSASNLCNICKQTFQDQ